MKCKNTSVKVIGIGKEISMPGEVVTIPEDFEKNPVILSYIKNGTLVVVDGDTTDDASESSDNENSVIGQIHGMKRKSQMIPLCNEYGVDYSDDDTFKELKDRLISTISEATSK